MLAIFAAGCGGDDDFAVTLLRSPVVAEDPLAGVDTLELRLPTGVTRVPWHDRTTTGYKAHLPSVASGAQLTVAALSGGQVVAAGRSVPLAAGTHAATVYLGLVDQFTSTPTAPALADARFGATATLLGDGRVLVVGGATAGGPRTPDLTALSAAVTLYDPARGSFSDVGSGSFAARIFHAAVATDGGAFIFGGQGANGGLSDIVRFDATANTLSTMGTLPSPRWAAASAALGGNDDGLLVIGGYTDATTLATDALVLRAGAVAATVPLPAPRAFATVVTLANGDVLVSGGLDVTGAALADALVYSASANAFQTLTATGDSRATMLSARVGHSATLLGDGTALIYGGSNGQGSMALPEVYSPSLSGFVTVGPFNLQERERQVAVTLADGSALIFGGESAPSTAAAQVAVRQLLRAFPTAGALELLLDYPPPPERADAVGLVLRDGSVFFAGGAVGPDRTLAGGAQLLVPCFDDCLLATP